SWRSSSIAAGCPKPAVPTPTSPSASSSSTTTSHVRAGGRPADEVPRASTTPSSAVSGVPTGRPTPFGAGAGRGATVATRIRTTGVVTSVAGFRIDDVPKRTPVQEAAEIVAEQLDLTFVEPRRSPGAVRREDDVRLAPQRMIGRQGLLDERVEHRS